MNQHGDPLPLFDPGRTAVPAGVWLKMPTTEAAEIMAHAGFDFVIVDLEHAPLTLETAYSIITVASRCDLACLVRVPDHTPSRIQRVLDAGARGVLIPHVDTEHEARAVARATRFPPRGDRGAGSTSRAGLWGMRPNADYLGERALCVPQLESADACQHASDILALDDVDGVFIGVADLALSLDTTPADPQVQYLINEVLHVAKEHGKPCGLPFPAPNAAARQAINDGCGFVALSNDASLLAEAATDAIRKLREQS